MDLIIDYVPAPNVDKNKPFAMLASLLDFDPYLGRCLIGKVLQGSVKVNENVKVLNLENLKVENGRLTKLLRFQGTKKIPIEEVFAGDIICIAGLNKASVSDTICNETINDALLSTPIDPPSMAITITVNDSEFAGTEGKKVTSTLIRSRLLAEAETNVAVTFSENETKDAFEIGGRGELQLGVLIETMRREGYEVNVSRPRVLFKKNDDGSKLEPFEEVTIDVDDDYSSAVIDSMNQRKSELKEMKSGGKGKTRLIFKAPSRGLIGYQNQFLTETKGTGVLNRVFDAYDIFKGEIKGRRNGVLIATDKGEAVAFALFNLQSRGSMFVEPKTKVYKGMIVGEHNRDNDLEVNVLKGKKLTNVRASGTDQAVILTPPRKMTLEQMMAYMADDELLEVTPKSLRLRKKILVSHLRKRAS